MPASRPAPPARLSPTTLFDTLFLVIVIVDLGRVMLVQKRTNLLTTRHAHTDRLGHEDSSETTTLQNKRGECICFTVSSQNKPTTPYRPNVKEDPLLGLF